MYFCYLCKKKLNTIDLVIDHLKIVHYVKENVNQINCIVNSACKKQYASFRALRVHVKSCEKTIRIDSLPNDVEDSTFHDRTQSTNDSIQTENATTSRHKFTVPVTQTDSNDNNFYSTNLLGSGNNIPSVDDFLNDFIAEIISLKVNDKTIDSIFKMCEQLINGVDRILISNKNISHGDLIKEVIAKLHSMNSKKKREKFFAEHSNYNQPEQRAIGVHWEMKRNKKTGISLPTQVQSKFQFVPISKTLISLFDNNSHFKQLYLEYNSRDKSKSKYSAKHMCESGRYQDFCCGEMFEKNGLFSKEPMSIQIQIFIDAFELCEALKPRAGVHTQMAIYFAIMNLPHELAYNQNNLHLVALCYSNDLKTKHTDYNNLWDVIVKDVALLEKTGIIVDSKTTLKGNIR